MAVALFDERGFDEVTIDEIATTAGISRRTFFRWFASKEDAVLPDEDELLDRFRRLLEERPADEPIMVTVRRATSALVTRAAIVSGPDALVRQRLVRDHPSIHARSLELRSRWETAVRDVLAEHLGVDPETSLIASVTAAAAVGAARSTVEVWLHKGGQDDLVELLDEAFDLLGDGPMRTDRAAGAVNDGTPSPAAP